ncbi:Hypothetical_protein [Hexamita inflata]|uniref:Hypothetical_protein n=1 Tax=Hexamita inflata TaxID=28002 RepID=A0AA86QLD1_9EUKA|nr:Hypothetical protein HINF_LOCUS49311 [Hexamita inflata]
MQLFAVLACYENFEINVYQNRTVIQLLSYYPPNILENSPQLQHLCASQLSSPLNIELLDAQNKVIATFQLIVDLFPTVQIELNSNNLVKTSEETFLDLSLKMCQTTQLQYKLQNYIMLSQNIAGLNVKEQLFEIEVPKQDKNVIMIISISVSVSILVLFVVLTLLFWLLKKQKATANISTQQKQIDTYKACAIQLFEKQRMERSSSRISQLNPKILDNSQASENVNRTQFYNQNYNQSQIGSRTSFSSLVTESENDNDSDDFVQRLDNGTVENPLKIQSVLQPEPESPKELPKSKLAESKTVDDSDLFQFLQNKDIGIQEVKKQALTTIPDIQIKPRFDIKSLKDSVAKQDDPMAKLFSKLGIKKE